jgi:hypothetical protein
MHRQAGVLDRAEVIEDNGEMNRTKVGLRENPTAEDRVVPTAASRPQP